MLTFSTSCFPTCTYFGVTAIVNIFIFHMNMSTVNVTPRSSKHKHNTLIWDAFHNIALLRTQWLLYISIVINLHMYHCIFVRTCWSIWSCGVVSSPYKSIFPGQATQTQLEGRILNVGQPLQSQVLTLTFLVVLNSNRRGNLAVQGTTCGPWPTLQYHVEYRTNSHNKDSCRPVFIILPAVLATDKCSH